MQQEIVNYRDNDSLRQVNYQYEIINEKSTFVMCGYYWGKDNINKNNKDGLTYGDLAQRLINYCKKNKCNYFLAEIPEFARPGGYQIAINFKPTFILQTLPIIYPRKAAVIDTDMTIRKYPSLFDIDYDFIGFNWLYEPHQIFPTLDIECFDPYMMHTSGGMLVFNQTKPAINLLKGWEDITRKNPGKAEDRTISVVFNKNLMLTNTRCLWLPITYFYIPFFYEIEDVYDIPRKFRKEFKHIKDFKKEHTFGEIFDIKVSRDIFIHHPEQLTSDEQAALQGADSDRVPVEFYIENGRKLKCFNQEKGLINIPELYCSTKSDIKAFSKTNKLIELNGFAKLYNKKLKPPTSSKRYTILKKDIKYNQKYLIVFSNTYDSPGYSVYDFSSVFIERPEKCSISYVIYSIMKKFNKNILFIENNSLTNENVKNIINQLEYEDIEYDFSCINTNSNPVYKNDYAKKCNDTRSLFSLTTDLLYFSNNKWGKNLLKLWHLEQSINKKIDSRYTLSRAYNRYMYAIYSRSKWLDYSSFIPSNNIFDNSLFANSSSYERQNIYFPDSVVQKFNKKINIYDYFIQCADRRSLLKGYGNPYQVHFISGKWKRNI